MSKEVEIVSTVGKDIKIDRDEVLKQLDCLSDNPLYPEYIAEYDRLFPDIMDCVEAKAAIGFGPFPDLKGEDTPEPGTEALFVIATAGVKITRYIDDFFAKGESVKAMIANSMANSTYFAFENVIQEKIREICGKRKIGISRRFDAPVNLPMEIHKYAFDLLNAAETLNISITNGYMFDPVKSSCQVYEISPDPEVMKLSHDCSKCGKMDCVWRDRMSGNAD